MRRLALYPEPPQLLAGKEELLRANNACRRCDRWKHARSVCMRPGGAPGGVLLLGDVPGADEDSVGKPFVSPTNQYVTTFVRKRWAGPIAVDAGVRCSGSSEVSEHSVDACRGYTARTLSQVLPSRVIAFGSMAMASLTGMEGPLFSLRRSFTHWTRPDGAKVPVFFLPAPADVIRNRFRRSDFEEDLAWALTANPEPLSTEASVQSIESGADARLAVEELQRGGRVVFDVESSGIQFDADFRVVCLASFREGHDHGFLWSETALDVEEIVQPLRELLADASVEKGGWATKYDMAACRLDPRIRTVVRGPIADGRVWRKLLEGGEVDGKLAVGSWLVGGGGHKSEADRLIKLAVADLRALARESLPTSTGKKRRRCETTVVRHPDVPDLFGDRPIPTPTALENIRTERADSEQYAYGLIPRDVCERYNGRDVHVTGKLLALLWARMEKRPDALNAWNNVSSGAIIALEEIESVGMRADTAAIEMLADFLKAKISLLNVTLAGFKPMNWSSPIQVGKFLFEELKLKPTKITKGGAPSVDEESLERLKGRHPCIDPLLELRELSKVLGTYAEGLQCHIRADGCIHTTYLPDGARTGRLASASPNLTNIPIRSEIGNEVRKAFAARLGYVLLEMDFSQLELRMAAAVSQDALMIAIFKSKRDYHRETAKLVCGVAWGVKDWDALTDAEREHYRQLAKVVNFGLLYGKTAQGLAAEFGCSVEAAEAIVGAILGTFKDLRRCIDATLNSARTRGGVNVLVDWQPANWRPLYALGDADEENKGARRNAENGAYNSLIQGGSAHLCTRSLRPIQQLFEVDGLDARLVLTIHDSIIAEVREGQEEAAHTIMHDVMTSYDLRGVPLVVDTKLGKSWGTLAKWHPKQPNDSRHNCPHRGLDRG